MKYVSLGDLHGISVPCFLIVLFLAESIGMPSTCRIGAVFVVHLTPPRGLGKKFSAVVLSNGMSSHLLFLVIIKDDRIINMVHHEAVKSYRANSIHESMKFGYKYSFLVFSLFWRDATILTYCVRRQKS